MCPEYIDLRPYKLNHRKCSLQQRIKTTILCLHSRDVWSVYEIRKETIWFTSECICFCVICIWMQRAACELCVSCMWIAYKLHITCIWLHVQNTEITRWKFCACSKYLACHCLYKRIYIVSLLVSCIQSACELLTCCLWIAYELHTIANINKGLSLTNALEYAITICQCVV